MSSHVDPVDQALEAVETVDPVKKALEALEAGERDDALETMQCELGTISDGSQQVLSIALPLIN